MNPAVDETEVTRFLEAWFAVRQFIQSANFNRFQQAGLSATQFMLLNLLPDDTEAVTIGDLARKMNLKPATVAKTVDSLEARDMVARTKSAADGRLVLVTITEHGKKLQNAAVGQFRDHMSNLFRAIPAQDRAGLLNGLESLVRVATLERGIPTGEAGGAPPARHNSPRSPTR